MSAQVLFEQQRGLLDDPLVVGSDFGRTPVPNPAGFHSLHDGRDHNIGGFTVLLAGGGVKAGLTYGATDEFGFKLAENPVYINDLHATILYLIGLDHTRDVAGRVEKDIIAGERA